MTRTDHCGTDPRNSSSLCSCPSRAQTPLCLQTAPAHRSPPTACLPNTAAALQSPRSSTGRDSPSLTHQLCLADLSHPELNPGTADPSPASRHQRSHAAGVCMGSYMLEICSSFPFHCPDTAKMLHLQAGEAS